MYLAMYASFEYDHPNGRSILLTLICTSKLVLNLEEYVFFLPTDTKYMGTKCMFPRPQTYEINLSCCEKLFVFCLYVAQLSSQLYDFFYFLFLSILIKTYRA